MKRIAIIGAGGVGGYLAHRLCAAGHEVAVLARGAHLAAIRARGLTLADTGDAAPETVRPAIATEDPGEIGPVDLAVFAVKGQDMEDAVAASAPLMAAGGHAVSFLNGIEGPEVLARAYGRDRALQGIARISAVIEAPGTIRKFTEFANYVIGDMDGGQGRAPVPEIRALFEAAGIGAPECADVTEALWVKFVGLTAFAAITAGARTDCATMLAVPELRDLTEALIDECIAVATARGVSLSPEAKADTLSFMATLPAAMRASLAHDLSAGKRLETDWLSGAVVRLGAELGVATPAHRTVAALLAPYRDGGYPGGERI